VELRSYSPWLAFDSDYEQTYFAFGKFLKGRKGIVVGGSLAEDFSLS
jgi:hypothetical protein